MEGVALTNRNRSGRYFSHCIPLHKAALKGDWNEAETLFSEDPNLVRAHITERGLTALHIASMEGQFDFVSKLLRKMEEFGVDIENSKLNSVLCFAAAAGNVSIVDLMLQRHQSLAFIRGGGSSGDGCCTPLYTAALMGDREMFKGLYNDSYFDSLPLSDKVSILTTCINSGLYGLAKEILDQHRNLAVVANNDNETPLEILARTPAILSRHSSNIKGVFWETVAYIISPFRKMDTRTCKSDTYTLFAHLWNYARMYQEEDIEAAAEMTVISPKLLFTAAESENDEFLIEIINRYPDFLYTTNSMNHSIFHIAVLHRNVQIFNLIYELKGIKDLTARYIDTDGNNMLHLAAKLAHRERLNAIPGGAALQMQQDIMWFKEVEKIVPPSYRTMRNLKNQTPHELFFQEHEKMRSEGEKIMKKMAKSFMLVTLLIPTLAFPTALTDNHSFMAFNISVAVALFSSVILMLIFLYILTSRCNNKYFLASPICLVCGLFALLVSIGSIIVAFCFSMPLLFSYYGVSTVLLLLSFVFVVLGPLLVSILRSTFSSHLLFGSNNRLFP